MNVDYEWLLANIIDAIKQCRKCLNSYIKVFGWYSHYGQRNISFAQFYKDFGLWKEAIVQASTMVDPNDTVTDKLHAFEPIYNAGVKLYYRASNALYENEIADAFEDGGSALLIESGRFETQIKMINKIANQLHEEKHIDSCTNANEGEY